MVFNYVKLKRVFFLTGYALFLLLPFIALYFIKIEINIWNSLYETETLNLIINEIKNLFISNTIQIITVIIVITGGIGLFFGTILSSENRYLKSSENVNSKIQVMAFFSILPSGIFFIHLINNLDYIWQINTLIKILYYGTILIVFPFMIKNLLIEILKNRYNYSELIKKFKPKIIKRMKINELYEYSYKSQVIFLTSFLFLYTYITLKTNISIILVVILFWFLFISLIGLASIYSITISRYFLVDIITENDELKDAILIREEKDNFLRVIPKPSIEGNEERDRSNGILINKNKIKEIRYLKY